MFTHNLFEELSPRTRFLKVQYGDYAEGYERLEAGGDETYYAQQYTVDFLGELAKYCERVTVMTFAKTYSLRRLSNGVHVVGHELYRAGGGGRWHHLELIRLAARERCTHIVLGAPLLPMLGWIITQKMRAMAMFADSFNLTSRKEKLKYRLMSSMLNSSRLCWVSNHNLAASLDLARIGVDPRKIVPFDWPAQISSADFEPKTSPMGNTIRLIYVGMMVESKGVGDAIRAVDVLNKRGMRVELSLVGGQSEELSAMASSLGVDDQVHFLGRQPHYRVITLMNEHDAVVVPSRHEYPEGLPMTIYEGLCSRSPVIFSDHPMFKLRLTDGKTGVCFQASSPASLADAIMRLKSDTELYTRLSASADEATASYLCPVKWDRMLASLLSNNPATQDGIRPYSLAGNEYGPNLLANL